MAETLRKAKIQPRPVQKIHCQKCNELLMKIYPNAFVTSQDSQIRIGCAKCTNNAK